MVKQNRYMIEAVVDGVWHWFAGRSDDRFAATLWATTDDKAVVFTNKAEADRERLRLGGITFLRSM